MKKCSLLLFLLLILLTGCGKQEEKLLTCKYLLNDENPVVEQDAVLSFLDNKIKNIDLSTSLNTNDRDTVDELTTLLKPYDLGIEKGSFVEIETTNEKTSFFLHIDFSLLSKEDGQKIGVLKDENEAEVRKAFEEMGYSCE